MNLDGTLSFETCYRLMQKLNKAENRIKNKLLHFTLEEKYMHMTKFHDSMIKRGESFETLMVV